jgi:hypothetical protein
MVKGRKHDSVDGQEKQQQGERRMKKKGQERERRKRPGWGQSPGLRRGKKKKRGH